MPQLGLTPGRSTTLTIDVPDYALIQPPWRKELFATEIEGGTSITGTQNITFIRNIGYRCSTVTDSSSSVHELGSADSSMFSPTNGTMPSGFAVYPIKKWNSDLTGVPQGAQVASGDNFVRKNPGAGDDWRSANFSLITDLASYPPPSSSEDIVPVDRVFVSNAPGRPDDNVTVRFKIPGAGGGAAVGTLLIVYFDGVGEVSGTVGEYAVALCGDGVAFLFSRNTDGSWLPVKQFRWCPPHMVVGTFHVLKITSDAYQDSNGFWQQNTINIASQTVETFGQLIASLYTPLQYNDFASSYLLNTNYGNLNPFGTQPIRFDVRTDVRALFKVYYDVFAATGTLYTQIVKSPVMGVASGIDHPIYLTLFGSFPPATSVTASLIAYDDTDGHTTTVAGTLVFTSPASAQFSFTRVANASRYQAQITLNASSDLSRSPAILRVLFSREGVVAKPGTVPTPVVVKTVKKANAIGGEADPTTDSASFEVNDYEGLLGGLATRGGQTIRFETEGFDPANPTHTSTIFIGKIGKASGFQQGPANIIEGLSGTTGLFPATKWKTTIIDCLGQWKRFSQAKTTQAYNFGIGAPDDADKPWKITDIVNELLLNGALPATMIDVPNISLRLLAGGDGSNNVNYRIEPYTQILPLALGYVRNYLGGYVVFDPNATNGAGSADLNGCWRVRFASRPVSGSDYNAVAEFVPDIQGSVSKQKALVFSYPTVTSPLGATIPTAWMKRFTLKEWIEPPENNAIKVTGTVLTSSLELASGGSLTSEIYNYPAAQFFDGQPIAPDPSNPDYTDGSPNIGVLIDPGLTTQSAVDFVCRRMYDLSCHSRKWMSFVGHAIYITDALDTLQIRPRLLRFGDAVIYNNEYWIVNNVTFESDAQAGGSLNQRALYELFQIPQLMFTSPTYQSSQLYSGAVAEQY